MSNSEWRDMNEVEFEALLQESLPESPPNDITETVTPWRRSINCVLAGLALNAITLNFLYLDYILPAIGLVLMLLGFRTLRRENKWFQSCYAISIVRLVYTFTTLALNTTIYHQIIYDTLLFQLLSILNLAILFLQVFCLWKAFSAIKRKAGLPAKSSFMTGLMIWYAVVVLVALWGIGSLLMFGILLVCYIIIIRGLIRLSKELDEAGYAIVAAPVRLTDKVLVAIIAAALALAMACGYLFGGSYPMEWTAAQPTEQAELTEIKEQLLALGFPGEVLKDLTAEDILACEGAQRIFVDWRGHSVEGDTLRITGVAVELSGTQERWKLFHHFRWVSNSGFYGTESLQIIPASHIAEAWREYGDVTGQVLYTLDGQDYTAPYYSLGNQTYTFDSFLFGDVESTDIFATFSMPKKSENQRGYVSYHIEEIRDGAIIDSWINYTHQNSWKQYPAQSAVENQMIGKWYSDNSFSMAQDALQFFPNDDVFENDN